MENWNDERLDELNLRVDGGFTKVDQRFGRLEGEMKDEFAKLATKEELGEVNAELGGLSGLKGDVAELKGDVAGLKRDAAGLKGDVAELKEDVAELQGDVGGLKVQMGQVKTEVGGLKYEMGEVKVELRELNKRFDRLLHALMIAGVGVGITMFGAVAGFITQA